MNFTEEYRRTVSKSRRSLTSLRAKAALLPRTDIDSTEPATELPILANSQHTRITLA